MKPTKILSLDDFDNFESKHLVNSPRSLEACYREGIDPEELLYIPPDKFKHQSLSPQVQDIHYEFFESKRLELLQLVRNVRRQIVASEDRMSRSSSVTSLNHRKLYGKDIKRAKEKQVRMMTRLVSYETTAAEKLNENQRREQEKARAEEQRKKQLIKEERRKAEEKRLKELEKIQKEIEEEKEAKRKALIQFEKEMEESAKQAYLEEMKLKEIELRRQNNDKKLKEHLKKVEEYILQMQREKEIRMKERNEEEKWRQENILRHQKAQRKKIQKQSKEKEVKREEVRMSLEEQMEKKRQDYYAKKAIEEQKSKRFMEEQANHLLRIRSLSNERDLKILKTRESAENILEERRQKLTEKSLKNQQRVERQKELIQQQIEYKKHVDMLKSLKKEWNVRRQKKKDDYMKHLAKLKMRMEEERLGIFTHEKEKMIKTRADINAESQLQQFQVKEALFNMAVTKKWDPKEITAILEKKNAESKSMRSTQESKFVEIPMSR